MAMGRQKDGQGDLMVSWSEMPRSPGGIDTLTAAFGTIGL